MKETVAYSVSDVKDYINWIYFFHSWGFEPKYSTVAETTNDTYALKSWVNAFPDRDKAKADAAIHLYEEAERFLSEHQELFQSKATYAILPARSDKESIIIDGVQVPFLRQQHPDPHSGFCLCLSDFISPKTDKIGIFAATVASKPMTCKQDEYSALLIKTLSERIAEATVEKTHEFIRKHVWKYGKDECLTIKDMLSGKFCGIRPAVGYPSIPDQSINFIIDKFISFKDIGIKLTENGAMNPEASVSGFILAHPEARYFSVGKISMEQLSDYSHRRGIDKQEIKKFLITNIT